MEVANRQHLRIGELARRCGVTPDTVRFYERQGLLAAAARTPAGYRVYGPEEQERLAFIRQAQTIGLTLEDIGDLLRWQSLANPDECRRVAALLRQRIAAIDRKLEALEAFRGRLAESLERCEGATTEACPVILELGRPREPDARGRHR